MAENIGAQRLTRALVVISTYQGSRFLEQQIRSILDQCCVDVTVLIRDDGSTDATPQILSRLSTFTDNILVIKERRIGSADSFLRILQYSRNLNYDVVLLCDQDDIWESSKISRQLAYLARVDPNMPALCFTGYRIVDENNREKSIMSAPPVPAFDDLLLVNNIVGCTMALNFAAVRLICETLPRPGRVAMHDWWIAQVVGGVGTLVRLDEPLVRYRQHGANQIGAARPLARLRRMGRLVFAGRPHPLLPQLIELRDRVGERLRPPDLARLVHVIAGIDGPLLRRMALAREVRRESGLLTAVLIAAGYFRNAVRPD